MARAPRKGKAQPLLVASHFQEALVLNQYLISLFGIDPLVTHKDGTHNVRPLEIIAKSLHCEYKQEAVDHLIEKHYKRLNRPLRRCQPRDLLNQVRNYCVYNSLPVEMRPEYFDRVVPSYFTVVAGK